MANITIRGMQNVENHFKNQKCAFWKLYIASDLRTPISSNMTERDMLESWQTLNQMLETLDHSNAYILDCFAFKGDKTQGSVAQYVKPQSSICFSLKEDEPKIIAGDDHKKAPAFSGNPSIEGYVELVGKYSRLLAEVTYKDQVIDGLHRQVNELQETIDELEEELEEMEQEEEEAEKVAGTQAETTEETLKGALVGLIKQVPSMLANMKGGAKKINVDLYQGEEQQQEEPGAKVAGLYDTAKLPDLNIIVKQLFALDNDLHAHLFKLLLIGQQQPETFKALLNHLESM